MRRCGQHDRGFRAGNHALTGHRTAATHHRLRLWRHWHAGASERRAHDHSKFECRSCRSRWRMPRWLPGTSSRATPSAATRISPTSRPTRSCSKCRRPLNGVIREIRIQSGTTVTSGQVLAVIEERCAAQPRGCRSREASRRDRRASGCATAAAEDASEAAGEGRGRKLSPSVRRLVEENKLDPGAIAGSGKDGRLTKSDVVDSWASSPTGVRRLPRRRVGVARPGRAAGGPAAARAPGPRPAQASRRARRAARADDAAASAHRAAPGRSAVHPGAADLVQRGRSDGGAGAARPLQGSLREGARREARLHVVLRQGLHRGPEEISRRQRLG